jgi:pimeloyl-[acyl-carrier protein] synthase
MTPQADVEAPGAIEAALFNPERRDVRADPWPLCEALRRKDPVYESPFGVFILTEYETCRSVLRDPRFSVDPRKIQGGGGLTPEGSVGPAGRGLDHMMLFVDPPDHTRLRSLVVKAFTPRVVQMMRARVEELVQRYLDEMADKEEVDLIADYAYPLPVSVICEILGIPEEDQSSFKGWAWDVAPILDPFVSAPDMAKVVTAGMSLVNYFNELIPQRRGAQSEDLLAQLIAVEEEGERLTHEELISTCILLLLAGHETTMNLMGNGLLALMRSPSQLDRLRGDPGLIGSAVEELLRRDGPAILTARIAQESVVVEDKEVVPGRLCIVLIGAANRDPKVFADPDRLDVGREPNKHLAFSAGPHFCLGATLARLEAQAAIGQIIDRFGTIELSEEPEWRRTVTFRGLESLNVRLTA